METTYTQFTTEHLGKGATDADLAEFISLCELVGERHPEWSEAEITDAVFGEGDYRRNAAQMLAKKVRHITEGPNGSVWASS